MIAYIWTCIIYNLIKNTNNSEKMQLLSIIIEHQLNALLIID